ncbi:uncharacterized protein [Panulirus ornatus]|uniref:uncharacterized protein n=1 Tax=Panulirus ornatus TaxID=150431 RepID=UPI003A87FEAE
MCVSRPWAVTLLLPLLWACLWVGTAGVGGQQEQWGSCHDVVCREVQNQMEGMTRLKRMRNYIIQTMHVMKTLLASLDEEVFDTTQDITRFIGHRCPAVHVLLEEFQQEFHDDDLQTTTQIQGSPGYTTSQDLTVTQENQETDDEDEDQSWPRIHQTTGSSHNNIHGSGSILEVTSPQNNGTSESGGYYTSSSSLDSSRTTDNIHTNDGRQKLTNKFDETATSQQQTTKHPKMFTGNPGRGGTVPGYNNNGGTGSGYGGADSVSSGTDSTWGTSGTVWSNRGPGSGGGHGGPGSGRGHGGPGSGGGRGGPGSGGGRGGPGGGRGGPGGGDGSMCRGVSRDSPHWVLGLDTWCPENCALGYCPAEYCVC